MIQNGVSTGRVIGVSALHIWGLSGIPFGQSQRNRFAKRWKGRVKPAALLRSGQQAISCIVDRSQAHAPAAHVRAPGKRSIRDELPADAGQIERVWISPTLGGHTYHITLT
jgi:hypothetical protein